MEKDLFTQLSQKGQNNFCQLQFHVINQLQMLYDRFMGETVTEDGVVAKPIAYTEWEDHITSIMGDIKLIASTPKISVIKNHSQDPWIILQLTLCLQTILDETNDILAPIKVIEAMPHLLGLTQDQKRYIIIDRILRTELEKVKVSFWSKTDTEEDSVHLSTIDSSCRQNHTIKGILFRIHKACKEILLLEEAIKKKQGEKELDNKIEELNIE